MSAEWIFADHEWHDDNDPVMTYGSQKGTAMTTTKTTARKSTTAAKPATKETTMTTKPSFADRTAARIDARIKLQQEITAKVSEPTIGEPTSCLPGKTAKNLCDDPVEIEFLRYAATFYGWETNEFCTEAQAKKFGGTLKEGAEGVDLIWLPKTTKTGKNAGVTTQWVSKVYPATAFVWEKGNPDDHDYKVKKAEQQVRRAERALKAAKKEGQPKPKTKAQLETENDDLRTQMAQMQAMMAKLMAAQGITMDAATA